MKKKNNAGCIAAGIIFIVIVSIAGGSIWFVKNQYSQTQQALKKALSELPTYDEEATAKEAAKELGLQYPVPEPAMTHQEIALKAKTEANQLTKKKYPSSYFAKKQGEIFNKYKQAKPGKKISFFLKTTGETISGIFKGVFKDHKGRFIKVDFTEYRLPDVLEEHQYMFVEGVASNKITEKIKELKTEFDNERNVFFKEQKALITEKLYNTSGYSQEGERWNSNKGIFESLLNSKERSFSRKVKREKEKINERHKLFGFITVEIPEDN